jgi:hypothetical protein
LRDGEVDPIDFSEVKERFDKNTSKFKSSVSTFQGTSISFFAGLPAKKMFNLMYIDGSHNSDDVLLDAVLSFKHLEPGGLLIFDDYLWDFFDDPRETPRPGIDAFLSLKRNELDLVYFGYQVIIKKL